MKAKMRAHSSMLLAVLIALALSGCAASAPTLAPTPLPPTAAPTATQAMATPTQPPNSPTTQPPTPTRVPPTATPVPGTATPPLPTALRIPGDDPISLDPALGSDAVSARYLMEIFSGLVTLDRNLNVAPDIAEKWDVSGDGAVYTFYLRKGVKFQDGRAVTAQDFKYSLERAADPATRSPTASMYLGDIVGVNDKLERKANAVKGVQVIDDNTLQITIDARKSYFLAKLALPVAFVVDKNNVVRDGTNWAQKPNGTGPFKLKEYVPKQRLALVKNDNYYLEPKAQIEQVNFILASGATPFTTMYTNGELDVMQIGGNAAVEVRDPSHALNKDVVVAPQLETQFIGFNVRKPPFDDGLVRQAFALAINRRQFIDEQLKKEPLLAKSILPPGLPGYNDALPAIAYNPDRAKQLLAASKYAAQFPRLTWGTLNSVATIQPIAAMLKANLGVDVTIRQTEPGAFFFALPRSDNPYHIFDAGWIADYPDPENFIASLFRTNSPTNWSGYANPDLDKLIAQAAVERDASQRVKLYQQAAQKLLDDLPMIPFTHERRVLLVKPYVKGLLFPPAVISHLRYVSFGW
ncbi:MAG: peptide ABC transporter substrate-binding protein [Chloroflexi bacterium]|nr:peptide ABC transporter substrate-binding protein [Chloroflexota bacterium]